MRADSSESAGPFAVSVNGDSSNEITDPLRTDLIIGMDQKTVMLVNEALSKRGVLLLKCPIEHVEKIGHHTFNESSGLRHRISSLSSFLDRPTQQS